MASLADLHANADKKYLNTYGMHSITDDDRKTSAYQVILNNILMADLRETTVKTFNHVFKEMSKIWKKQPTNK